MVIFIISKSYEKRRRFNGILLTFYFTCFLGDTDAIKILIKHGANINAKDDFKCTPLYCAEKIHTSGISKCIKCTV